MEFDFFGFDDESEALSKTEKIIDHSLRSSDEEDDEGDGPTETHMAETKAFWDSQNQSLQEALCRRSSTEMRIQGDTEEAITNLQTAVDGCSICACSRECGRNCVLKYIANRLRDAGHNSAVCKSKWRSSPEIPSGEHKYVDAIIESKNMKKKPIRLIIEPNFRSQFEMARANHEYNRLVSNLPEIFVGKTEKLKNVTRIMCGAAKKCMKDNKMHMAPWRKLKYMQSKWLGTSERLMPCLSLLTAAAEKQPKPRASMLTFDLHCTTAVEVV